MKLFIVCFACFFFPFVQAVSAAKVVIDAGHGGKDPGAVSVNGLEEKHVNLDIAYKLQEELARLGYETVMTRTGDQYISLQSRVEVIFAQQPDLFVSIHANYYHNPDVRGSMVLYYDNRYPQDKYPASEAMNRLSPESRKLAELVLESIVAEAGTENRRLLPSSAYVIRMGNVPSILVETAFLSNAQDVSLLQDDSVRRKMAVGIAKGIDAYLTSAGKQIPPKAVDAVFPDTANHWARDAILHLREKEILIGSGNLFEPDRPMTRAEFLTILDRMFPPADQQNRSAADPTGENRPQPADLSPEHWAYPVFARALASDRIHGYPDGTVRPDRSITRGEVAVLLHRTLKFAGVDAPSETGGQQQSNEIVFRDVPGDLWSAEAIYSLRKMGLVEGMPDGLYMPERMMTRAEMAALAYRCLSMFSGTGPGSGTVNSDGQVDNNGQINGNEQVDSDGQNSSNEQFNSNGQINGNKQNQQQ